ncbi:MAG: hypothetical protein ACFE9D_07500 [Promethearchaeota archaeon]
MPIGNWYIPEGKLDDALTKLIPGEDTIIYTSLVYVKTGDELRGYVTKVGQIAITNRGVAFYAKRKGLTGGLISFRGGPIAEYARYDHISHIDSQDDRVIIHVTPDIDAEDQDEKWFELVVVETEPYETKKEFEKRKGQFSAVLEHALYRYRTGQARPDLPKQKKPAQPNATRVRATLKSARRRRVQYCPKCGAFLEEPEAFCEVCGKPLHPTK